jgi:hypothetical protein
MKDSLKKPKPTFETLLKESQVVTGKDPIKRKDDKVKELALFQEALEFEARHRMPNKQKKPLRRVAYGTSK